MKKLLKKNNHLLKKKLDLLFKNLNIKKDDNLILHSNMAGLLQFNKTVNDDSLSFFLNYLRVKLGKKSTLIIPVYNYDFTKTKKIHFEKANSHLGIFSNYVFFIITEIFGINCGINCRYKDFIVFSLFF